MNYEVVLAEYGVYCPSGFFCYDPALFPRTNYSRVTGCYFIVLSW